MFTKKNMKKIRNFIFELNKFTSKLNTKNYIRFWNLLFIFSFKSLRFRFLDENVILVLDKENKIYISQKLRGYFYFKSIKHRFRSLGEMYFFDKITFEKDDIIVDCGANIGEIYNSLKIFTKYSFQYFGFEPVKSEFQILKLNSVNKIEGPFALFDKNESSKLYIHIEGADSTLIEDTRYNQIEEVECIRLDSVIALKNNHIKLLKLEAEGAEMEVLIGCGEILKNIQYISADLGFELEQGTKSNEKEVSDFLLKNNFYKIASNSRHINLFKNKSFS